MNQNIGIADTSVDIHGSDFRAGIFFHPRQDIVKTQCQAFQNGARHMTAVRCQRQTENGGSCPRVEIGKADSGSSRHNRDAFRIRTFGSQRIQFFSVGREPDSLTEPVNQRARRCHIAFQHVNRFPVSDPGNQRKEAPSRKPGLRPDIQIDKSARTLRNFHFTRIETAVTEESRHLVAETAANRNRSAEK